MIELRDIKREDIAWLMDHKLSTPKPPHGMRDKVIDALALSSFAYTAFDVKTGEIVFCAGIHDPWPGRAEAWALLADNLKHKMLAVHRSVLEFLDKINIKRIEAVVDRDFTQGHRWVELLGFTLEADRMRAYGYEGQDCSLYARVKAC